jgi:hypothetical protein
MPSTLNTKLNTKCITYILASLDLQPPIASPILNIKKALIGTIRYFMRFL